MAEALEIQKLLLLGETTCQAHQKLLLSLRDEDDVWHVPIEDAVKQGITRMSLQQLGEANL